VPVSSRRRGDVAGSPLPDHLQRALVGQDVPEAFIAEELARMREVRLAPTASRSVLGIMNEFTFMAESTRADGLGSDPANLDDLAGWLARTPCGPLFKRHIRPDRELRALVEQAT
jgi:hypothetical protein